MAKKKLRVGILFGGRSGEHEVSLLSGASILKAIDRTRYDILPIAIDKQGHWLSGEAALSLLRTNPLLPPMPGSAPSITRSAHSHPTTSLQIQSSADLAHPANPLAASLDVVFPVLHGTFGEDGTIQGLFELADIAYVGSGVLGSSSAMDKDAMKRLFSAANLPQTPYLALLRS
ncbi:MAG TPA: D-alanine--D-alanine ligase A, partial [Acidobacteriaceae bacterium]|nr:D-alanine--D-alanine ligase A [Acidobacteriaceae bacterium]